MSDQNPPAPTSENAINEQESADLSQRLASLSAPRPGVASIWQRRDGALAAEPATPITAAASGVLNSPPALRPAAAGGVGRLTRVTAAELWTDASAMSAWVAANAEALAELTGLEGLRFDAPSSRSDAVLGTIADGAAVCVVCEVGPSTDERLGTLLRVAALQDGGTVMWLNGGPSDSHVAALSWLNRATPPRFYLAKATGVRIDGSASAPLFELLVRPPRVAGSAGGTSDAPQRRVEDHVPEG
ncbi:MAG: hypothetical protein ACXWWQ_06810 [Candidatus Limnocylindria bacterium]